MNAMETQRALKWQCRRGLLEVDLVLNHYLDEFFLEQSREQQLLFVELLKEQDADLFEWFTQRSEPEDAELAAYVKHILACLAGELRPTR